MADNSPAQRIASSKNAKSLGGVGAMVFPADLATNAAYYTKITFRKYDRNNPASAPTEKNSGTVYLPIPIRLPEQYTLNYNGMALSTSGGMNQALNWTNENYPKIQAAFNAGNGWRDAISGAVGTAWNNRPDVKIDSWKQMAVLMTKEWADTQPGAAFGRLIGAVQNPHMTAIFEGVHLRNFELEWKLSPRSVQESKSLLQIERFIKQHSHPAFTNNTFNFALDYPDEVYVTFENTDYLEPIKKAVVTHISLDKAENGPAFYASGAPVFYSLRIGFMEVEIRTAEDWGDGGQAAVGSPPVSSDASVKRSV